uniref:L1 transposable element RRM domain-containing protein n=1 Tax=Micrurus corallinus TaxID=54390 RepID=A0A2D4EV61_MICCO
MKADIQKLNNKFGTIQETVEKNEQKLVNMEQRTENVEKKLEDTEENWKVLYCELQEAVVHLELKKAAFFFRFQNIVEEKKEDLRSLMAELIAEALQKDKTEIMNELDEVYQVQTHYACRHKLPGEVHVRFVKRTTRDMLYGRMRDEPLVFKGHEVVTLKQIPRRVRTEEELSIPLNAIDQNNIPFRWLTPE